MKQRPKPQQGAPKSRGTRLRAQQERYERAARKLASFAVTGVWPDPLALGLANSEATELLACAQMRFRTAEMMEALDPENVRNTQKAAYFVLGLKWDARHLAERNAKREAGAAGGARSSTKRSRTAARRRASIEAEMTECLEDVPDLTGAELTRLAVFNRPELFHDGKYVATAAKIATSVKRTKKEGASDT